MEQTEKKRKHSLRGWLFLLIPLVMLILIGGFAWQRYGPTKEKADLDSYFAASVSADAADLAGQPGEKLALVLNNELLGYYGYKENDTIYICLELVQKKINSRFYWDKNEQLLIYTLPTESVKDTSGANTKNINGKIYISLACVQNFTNIEYTEYDSPDRLVINSEWGEVSCADTKGKTAIRLLGGPKSPVLTEVEAGTKLTWIDDAGKWSHVKTEDGYIGYVKKSALNTVYTEERSRDFSYPEYSSLKRDHKINLTWFNVSVQDANSKFTDILSTASGVNVISPTWVTLSDNAGNVSSIADSSCVQAAHEQGVEVWMLVSNIVNAETTDIDTTQILTHTSIRETAENNILSVALANGVDGINIDLEGMSSEVGDSYIQFIREMSVLCRNNGLVLSVDVPPLFAMTEFYDRAEMSEVADYVIVMAYDEHYAGSEAGSVASLSYSEESVTNMLKEVSADKLILGIPFYTRLWAVGSDGSVSSTAYGMEAISSLLASKGVSANPDESTGQNYAEYTENGISYQVWLEDAGSVGERMQVMQNHSLAGVASWAAGYETEDIWQVIQQYLQ